jgi:hypothetical protein
MQEDNAQNLRPIFILLLILLIIAIRFIFKNAGW